MLRVFADARFRRIDTPCIPMLFPFWGQPEEEPHNPTSGRYAQYIRQADKFFVLADKREADIAVLPISWERLQRLPDLMRLAGEWARELQQLGIPTVVFYWSDFDSPIPLPVNVVARTSLNRSRRTANEFAMPAWSEDFVQKYCNGHLPIRERTGMPVVGFCGKLGSTQTKSSQTIVSRLLSNARRVVSRSDQDIRSRALEVCAASPDITCNFSIQDGFFGGVSPKEREPEALSLLDARRRYLKNMLESDYILCARGAGNFSYRLYETLSCGRIPVFIDTDCVLPYDNLIDWQKYMVWVDEDDLPRLAQRVLEHADRMSPSDYEALQYACRRLWEQWLSPQGFFRNLHHYMPLTAAVYDSLR